MSAGREQERGGSFGVPSSDASDLAATRWMRGAFASFYIILAITNFVMLDGYARISTTVLAALTAGLLVIAAIPLPRRWGQPDWGDHLGYVPVLDGVAQVAITGQIHYTTTLMLTLVGIAVVLRYRRTFLAATTLGCAGWLAGVVWVPELRDDELGYWAVQLGISALVAVILNEALRRRQRQLRNARDEISAVADRFGSLFHASPSGVAVVDEQGVIVAVNQAFCDLVGRSAEELVGSDCLAYRPGGDSAEQRFERPDGTVRWVWSTVGRSTTWTLIQLQDVTDRHLAEQAVRDSDRLLAAVSLAARRIRTGEDARNTIIGAIRDLAEADNVSLMEPSAGALFVTGALGAHVLGTRIPLDDTSMTARVFGDGQPVFLADATADPRVSPALLKMVEGRSMLWQPVIADGVVLAVLVVGWRSRVASVSDHRARAVAMLADETALAMEHERLLRRLEQMAFTDTLTGLPNRRAWQEQLATLFAQGRTITVAIADLDRFKRYNDTHGHVAGDELLQRAAVAFAGELHGDDVIARWGGEEFVIALHGAAAFATLERVRLATPDDETCSIGYAVWDGVESAEQLLERADEALYAAKNGGRNVVQAAPEPATVPS
ncbi:diguanylate cyclase (GGDEF)-like protein [Actinoplanes lutulentus]|uniref:PAS domain S-box-containing protein/diguanylate cyclase (GGDEF)-like protein n=1 Tax=Actinoplanes lutulentus TaxID=1287878 RepID=A0A327ZKL3_9ACTN|nr:sensor domain-containing diguanylate cyclase [Actinoplanes lutulentus]MBB2940904.1 diguanylate cyclase (GGDEF)-like protein [Actinoplanes lutulentus]RAK43213.1 PAS domain S-box-containing protein/diguanylate cyclase (GGDEF)-like protein [Actinoplanes lutulentus]